MLVAGDDFEHPVPEADDSHHDKRQANAEEQPEAVADFQGLGALRHQLPTDENGREEDSDEEDGGEKEGFAQRADKPPTGHSSAAFFTPKP